MFYEISITPSVFKTDCYTSRDVCDAEMRGIWSDLNSCLVIRDLRSGDWFREMWRDKTHSPHFAQKLLKVLRDDKRFRRFAPALADLPVDSNGWCREALASHAREALSGILSCSLVKADHNSDPLVCDIVRRHQPNSWWTQLVAGGSPRVRRNTAGFLQNLEVFLKCSNHLVFMDPNLDPQRNDYREFKNLLLAACRSDGVQPFIEIHRVCYEGMNERKIVNNLEWETRFRNALKPVLQPVGLDAEVFIWPEEHDRHILSNLGGIHMGNGLSINNNPNSRTTWTRLSRNSADEVRRQFDPSVNRPIHQFKISG